MDSNSILLWAWGAFGTIFTSVVLWKLRAQTEKNEKFAASITALESTAVNEGHVRTIIKEELSPINSALPDLIRSINEVKTYIAEERGYRAGQQASQRRLTDSQ